jgi:hypothetical protein
MYATHSSEPEPTKWFIPFSLLELECHTCLTSELLLGDDPFPNIKRIHSSQPNWVHHAACCRRHDGATQAEDHHPPACRFHITWVIFN